MFVSFNGTIDALIYDGMYVGMECVGDEDGRGISSQVFNSPDIVWLSFTVVEA